ncbi:MAG TPA: DEAD/DEAH box helicase [Pirellulaceae bacterium]|nr:DEAD/DEAH box helicase [Pirellulaceae bacterium]
MTHTLAITPAGHLRLVEAHDDSEAISAEIAQPLAAALAESSAAGLLLLASAEMPRELPAELNYWRQVSRRFFQAVCHLGEGSLAKWKSLPPPADEELAQLVAEAPPMRGLEYLDAELLKSLWSELRELASERAGRFAGGGAGWLRSIDPLWQLLGRVTFHLAENKRNPLLPFAFLATYSHRLSGAAKVAHLPLAEALKTYAGEKNRAQLDALLEPVRRAAERSELVRELLEGRSLFAPQAWTIRQAYRFLSESPRIEEAGVVVRVPDWWSARRPPRPQVQVQIGEKEPSELSLDNLLEFRAALTLDGEELTREEREQLLAATDGLALLRGKWVEIDREKLSQALDHWRQIEDEHADGISFIQGMRLLAGTDLGDGAAAADEVAQWSRITAGDWLRQTLERIRRPEQVAQCQPGRDLNATLRPYQADGVRWLYFLTELGLGACLADDMGLGKTIQIIDLLLLRKRNAAKGERRTNLLVIPASLIGNWQQELSRFAPSLAVLVTHRSECDADTLARLEKNPAGEVTQYDLVITTYGLARRQEWLAKVRWSLVILDEAQAIKNATSAQARSVKKLPAAGRIVLTGTPVENHLGDLWSLFDFCSPGLLGNAKQFKEFVKRLNQRQDSHAYGSLRRLVRPYILRRLKTDPSIVPDLPAKTEMRTECGLSKKQAALYERVVSDLAERLEKADGMARRGLVLSALMQLKQVCNHPAQFLSSGDFSPSDSSKFQRLKFLAEPISERQEKALVFTQFQAMTAPLAEYLAEIFGRPGLILHGGTAVKKRPELVKAFQSDDGPPFFVISLKAGGSGLNLTAASHVIHFDRWWNPAVENQATDRAFRIGQKRNVLVHKFVCRGTVEERIDALIASKQSVADQILSAESETQLTELSDKELLRFVALDIGRATGEE